MFKTFADVSKDEILAQFLSEDIKALKNEQTTIPKLAKNRGLLQQIENILPYLPTFHHFHLADSTEATFVKPNSVHLVVTSPPYWTLKKYNDCNGQLGDCQDYDEFIKSLKRVWKLCFKALVPGGRLVCVVGDVCLSRRKNNGRHTVVPLHASIQEVCRKIGYDNLAPIIWYKIANAQFEASGNSTFLGKPYEPNAVIKNDIEFILMQRKPGGYRSPSFLERACSVISDENHKAWFNQVWEGLTGASTRNHPAPYPVELATRLIRMFSFVGDVVLDPFSGSGTTAIAACKSGRNSINIEIDGAYFKAAVSRFNKEVRQVTSRHEVKLYTEGD